MLSSGLPTSRYVNVAVSMTQPGIVSPAINSLLIIGSSAVIDAGERARRYANISEVAHDFGTAADEYHAADTWFSQNPRPDNVYIGRWIKTASAGRLIGGTLTPTEQTLATWTAITTGSFKITVGAGPAKDISALSFAAAPNLNAVASAINTALTTATAGVTCAWDGQRFSFTATATGAVSTVSYLSPTGTGVDISGMLKGTAATGARSVPGAAPETAVSALATIDGLFSTQFYGVVVPSGVAADQLACAAYCEAANPPHYFGVTTAEAGALDPQSTTDLASQLSNFGYNKTAVQYSTASPYAICSYLSRILTTEWRGTNTMITLMYKREPGVSPEFLSSGNADVLQAKDCNVYTGIANGAQVIQYGTSASGEYTDTIIGADSLALDIQNALFNTMYTTNTKIPQTDAGMGLLLNAVTAVCSRYVQNGYLGPGVWNAPGFGNVTQGDLLPLGFYVYAPSIALQSAEDRAARRAPLLQVAARCASAIHEVGVLVFVMA
jgi:hypothetical protein